MSGSNRDERLTPVAIAGFSALAICGACVLIFFLGSLRGEQQNRADTSYRYQQSAKESAESACVGTDPGAVFECVVEKAEAASQAEHDQRDLAAQQQAAWGSMLSSAWSLGALIATALGLYWIKGTLDATRKGAEAAQGAVDETKRIGEAQTRAYLSVVGADFHVDRESRSHPNLPKFESVLHFKNSGATPAVNVSYYFSASVRPWKERDIFPDIDVVPHHAYLSSIVPGPLEPKKVPCFGVATAWEDYVDKLSKTTHDTTFGDFPTLVLYGVVFYEDVFGIQFRSRFAFIYEPQGFKADGPLGRDNLPTVQTTFKVFEPIQDRANYIRVLA
jgi:hypothetical protein